MAFLIDYIWQSTFCLLFFYGIYWVFLKNEKVFGFTRIYILITPILALLFPILRIPVSFNKPDISLEQSQLFRALTIEQVPEDVAGFYGLPEVTVQSTKLPMLLEFKDYFLIFYIIIIALLALRLFWQFMQIRLIREKGWYQTIFKLKENYFLVPTFGLAPIFSFFNQLFWDETQDLNPDEKDQIIKHEIEHIRQGHSWDVLYYQILSIVFWFNPAIHLMRMALVDVHEYLADESVLKQTKNKESYPKLIVKIAFKGMDLPIGNYFIRSTTLKRILMMKKSAKINWFKMAMIMPLTIMLLALVSMKTNEGIGNLLGTSTEKIELIKDQLLASQDSLEVAIKVKKTNNPKHYELIGALEGDKLTAQLGELIYEFSEISSEDEYLKVRSLINTLKSNSKIVKNYGSVKAYNQATKKPTPVDGVENWYKYLSETLVENLSDKEKELGIASEFEIEFIISKEGKVTNPIIKRSYGGGVDEIILQELVSSSAPKWNAAEIDGEKVDVVHNAYLKLPRMIASNSDKESLAFFPQTKDSPFVKRTNTIINDDTIFDVVEEAPIPLGGMQGWNEYLSSNLEYPEDAIDAGIEGTVYVVFIVTKEGKIEQPEILRGVSPSIDQEALRVISLAPDWTPGKQRGREMNVRMRLPIRFKQDSKAKSPATNPPKNVVDVQAMPVGGMETWQSYLDNNLTYPQEAKVYGIEGTVYLSFVVDKEGNIQNPEILRGIEKNCDAEALRLVENSPKWTPGEKDGVPVESIMRMPIRFDLKKHLTNGVPKPTEQFNEYVRKTINYPLEARNNKDIGTVIAKLSLDENGQITKTAIHKGVSKELNEEVLRSLEKAPNWNIGVNKGQYEILLPITFRINNEKMPKTHKLPNEIVVVGYSSQAKTNKVKPAFEPNNNLRMGHRSDVLVFDDPSSPTTEIPVYVYEGKVLAFDDVVRLTTETKTIFTRIQNPSEKEIDKFGDQAKKGIVYIEKNNK